MLVLASRSPRRRELLDLAGIPHAVRVADVDEAPLNGESPVDYVQRVARDKALAIRRSDTEIVLAADTTVVCSEQILGKPAGATDAVRMLELLSGRTHQVITGICFRYGDERVDVMHAITDVWFAVLSPEEIASYANCGEPLDKAGAYAIQGIASRFVTRIEGSYSNVVGLPVALVWSELTRIRSFLSSASAFPTEV